MGGGGDHTFGPARTWSSNVETLALSGSTFGFKVGGGLDFFITSHYSIGIDGAYRVAKVTTVHGNPTNANLGDFDPLEKPDGSNWPFDYSGMIAKAKIGFWY